MVNICKFCNEPATKYPKAHIIPAGFHEDIKDGLQLNIMRPGEYINRTHDGVYDQNVWCQQCEDEYGKYDGYALEVLRTPLDKFHQVIEEKELTGLEIEVRHPLHLQRFLISMLWRAHSSSKPMFSQVSLGKYEAEARSALKSKENFYDNNFDAAIFCPIDGLKIITNPRKMKIEGVNFYQFYLGKFEVIIKCDRQKLPKALNFVRLNSSGQLRIAVTKFNQAPTKFLNNHPLKLRGNLARHFKSKI